MENVKFREWVILKAQRDKSLQRELREMCRQDILFFCNVFVWSFNPRKSTGMGTLNPFVTFPLQDDLLLDCVDILNQIEPFDAVVRKSRYMGASYMLLLLFLHDWLFSDEQIELFMMSRKEDLVDGGPKSLFGKLDITLRWLPDYLLPAGFNRKRNRQKMKLFNPDTHSTIEGESTSATSGVGGRYKGMLFDEFALVEQAREIYTQSEACTDHRFFNSTVKGVHTQFHDLGKLTEEDNVRQFRLHWSDHPWFNEGLWQDDQGVYWSEWKINTCKRLGWSKAAIATELEIEDLASGELYFNEAAIAKLIADHARDPDRVGNLDGEVFKESPDGHTLLWFKGAPPPGEYGIGCDVAAGVRGTKATPSCMSVVNLRTGEKVAEYQAVYRRPEEFAFDVYHMAMWFYGAIINFENAGPGNAFRETLTEDFEYRNFRLSRKNDKSVMPTVTTNVGFGTSKETNQRLLDAYRAALEQGKFLNPSKRALEECLQFVYDRGWVRHSNEMDKTERVGIGANHGDQVMSDAMANQLVREAGMQPQPGGQQKEDSRYSHGWDDMLPVDEDEDRLDWSA